MNDRELLWKQYEQNVSLFRFYMDLLVKFNVFHYAVTGAIISFVLVNATSEEAGGKELVEYALLLPLLSSLFFAGYFVYGGILMNVLRENTFKIRDALSLGAAPDVGVLSVMLYMFALLYLLTAAGCTVLLCKL